MLTRRGHARRQLLALSAKSALLSLPLMRMLGDSEALAQGSGTPKLILTYFPTGYKPNNFWPGNAQTGPIQAFPAVLSPIEELGLKNDFLLLDGLNLHGSYDHNGGLTQVFAGWGAAGLWEGAGTKYQGQPIHGATYDQVLERPYSLDQMLADKWQVEALILGVASQRVVFPDPLSWKKNGVKSKAEDNPKLIFDRFFGAINPSGGGGSNSQAEAMKKLANAEKRVLDFLKGDLKRLENALGSEDKVAFQAHVAALDDINAEINKVINGTGTLDMGASCSVEPVRGLLGNRTGNWFLEEDNLADVFKIQRALAVQALACNITRIVVWQIGGGHSTTQLRSEGVTRKGGGDHHTMSHAGGPDYEDIQRGHIREIGKLALDLKNTKIQSKSLFDETLIYTASDSGDTGHVPNRVPAFFLGNLNGRFEAGGRVLKLNGRGYNHALISVAHLMGATEITEIGNRKYTGPLPELKIT